MVRLVSACKSFAGNITYIRRRIETKWETVCIRFGRPTRWGGEGGEVGGNRKRMISRKRVSGGRGTSGWSIVLLGEEKKKYKNNNNNNISSVRRRAARDVFNPAAVTAGLGGRAANGGRRGLREGRTGRGGFGKYGYDRRARPRNTTNLLPVYLSYAVVPLSVVRVR